MLLQMQIGSLLKVIFDMRASKDKSLFDLKLVFKMLTYKFRNSQLQ